MTITRENLKVFKPELLGSSDDAGGMRTKNEVQSGKLNELFSAISDIDHAQSSIDIAKCYPALDTANTSILLDGHVFISEPPADPLVSLFLVESDDLDDAARMLEMKEILESAVTAGSLFRSGAPGFLPNQNSFSREYLNSTYMFNGKEYRKTTHLRVGQIIAITVEYLGVEDNQWPRFTHYAMVTDINAPGNSAGNIVFDPPMKQATPDSSVSINGHSQCTKLRLVNDANPLKYHGVTKLTAATTSSTLPVRETSQNLLPAIRSEKVHSGLTISVNDDGANIVRKTLTQPATSSQTYTFDSSDKMPAVDGVEPNTAVLSFISGGVTYGNLSGIITESAGILSVTLSRTPDIGTPVSVAYIPAPQYLGYNSGDAFPSNSKIVRGTLLGTYVLASTGQRYSFIEKDDGIYTTVSNYRTYRIGIMNYDTGEITYEDSSQYYDVEYTCLVEQPESTTSTQYVLPVESPILETFYLQVETTAGALISASCDASGNINGTNVSGLIVNGLVTLNFAVGVELSTLIYNITELVNSLPPAELYGLNPLRIPSSGIIPIFRKWGTVALQHTQYQPITAPSAGQTKNIRAGARFADITDANGASLWTATNDHYTLDTQAGTVEINSDFAGFTAPFVLSDTIGELALVTDVGTNQLQLASELTQEYPINSTVASVQVLGDLQARVGKVRDMTAWSNNWDLDGDPATGNLNTVDYPIELTNDTAVNEDWVLLFTSDSSFRCIGKRIGQIAIGDTLNDFTPINPLTNSPFFIIRAAAFGGGWSAGEAIRFETFASAKPLMALRTVQAGHSQITTDKAVLSFRGNES
ncbi:hypothetical protein [Shewanella fidelis]|uniref:Coil containing protein n=1 Tax=Shewanella fidelis TaxID=173509 RepID=A0AAW8NMS2_9GAMM|nr:hypothetical protein [Shewanella fidelis]MDR8523481.1 hypothetical protein [Shewanella fidelis]MDW4813286.1 hypothetical protein [Shewanella fidelis]MDW4817342.1 hypothetical protein [Shewanella fidelis]MDW4821302.1 hypothetical protein [Shewanella fidelis]MDW4824620.1 hypothetical protein [Shewanella fidelis]